MLPSIEAGACASFFLCLIFFGSCLTSSWARSYSNGLIFYELTSHTPYLPPTVSVSRGRNLASVKYSEKGSIWSTFGQPCECRGSICGCCAGLKVDQYRFDQKVCANVTFVPQAEEAQLEVYLNERPSSKYGISVRNPTPFCIPVMMGVPMAMCVQLTDVAMVNNQLNMCMDFVVRLATTDLFEMHFQCMRMGLDGLQYVDKNGKPVLPTADHDEDDDENDDENEDEMQEQKQEEDEEEEEQREPAPIESEMLMASDQLNIQENDGDEEEEEAEEMEMEEAMKEEAVLQQEETPDYTGESELKPNEVIETITMMHNYTADGEKVIEKMPEVEKEELKKSAEVLEKEENEKEKEKEKPEEEEETTTIAEMANISENEINIDNDDDDDDLKENENENDANKEQVIETETEAEEESETEMATEVAQQQQDKVNVEEEAEEEEDGEEQEGEDADETDEKGNQDNGEDIENADNDEDDNADNADDDEDDAEDDEGEAAEDDDNDDKITTTKEKEVQNQPSKSNESSSHTRQTVDDLANEVFTQTKRRRRL